MATFKTQQESATNVTKSFEKNKQKQTGWHRRLEEDGDQFRSFSTNQSIKNSHPPAETKANNDTQQEKASSPSGGLSSSGNKNHHGGQPQRKYMLRYDLRLTIKPSEEPKKEVVRCLREVLSRIQSTDPSAVIYPWQISDAEADTIICQDDIPVQRQRLLRYFPGVRFDNAGGSIYPSMWMGTNTDLALIMKHNGHWFQKQKHGVYKMHLQCEFPVMIGWLLRSVPSIDRNQLQQDIETKVGFPVHARWQIVNSGHERDDKPTKAIHLRVDPRFQEEANQALGDLFRDSHFPLGIDMRLIPPMNQVVNPSNFQKLADFRFCQRQFNDNMVSVPSSDISSLIPNSRDTTLRDFLMKIPSTDQSDKSLFFTVDQPNKNNPCIFWFHPNDALAARQIIIGIIPFLRHRFRIFPDFSEQENQFQEENLYKFFKPEAVKRSLFFRLVRARKWGDF